MKFALSLLKNVELTTKHRIKHLKITFLDAKLTDLKVFHFYHNHLMFSTIHIMMTCSKVISIYLLAINVSLYNN